MKKNIIKFSASVCAFLIFISGCSVDKKSADVIPEKAENIEAEKTEEPEIDNDESIPEHSLTEKSDIPHIRTYNLEVVNNKTDGQIDLGFVVPSEINGYIGNYENDFDGDGKTEDLYIKLIEDGGKNMICAEMYNDGEMIDKYLLLDTVFSPFSENEIYISFLKLQNKNVIFIEDNNNGTIASGWGLTFDSVYYENNKFHKYHSYDFAGSDEAQEVIESVTNDFRNKGFNIKGLNIFDFEGNNWGTITQQLNAHIICSIEIKCTDPKKMAENYEALIPFKLTLKSYEQ